MTDSSNITLPHDLESLTAHVNRLEEGRAADYGMLADHQKLLENIEDRFTVLENAVKHRPFQVSVTDDIHGLTAYVHRLEKRVEQLEKNQLRWFTEARPAPEPQRDTSWHPHDAEVDGQDRIGYHPKGYERVVVMTRAGYIAAAERAEYRNWDERGDSTIVAWRYAKEGE